LNHLAFDPFKKLKHYQIPSIRYHEKVETYQQLIQQLKHPEEVLALFWCMNHKPIIEHELNNKAWHTVSYEKLLLETKTQLSLTADYLEQSEDDVQYHEKLLNAYNSLKTSDPSRQLFGWRKTLTKQSVERIQKVLDRFEVDYFNSVGEADYSKILNLKREDKV
ncbi:MAG: hypothetical protein AAF391_11860, partial [Bacteroidota bacterium]